MQHVSGTGETCTGIWWRNLREKDHLEDPGVEGRIILSVIFWKWDGVWIELISLRIGVDGVRLLMW